MSKILRMPWVSVRRVRLPRGVTRADKPLSLEICNDALEPEGYPRGSFALAIHGPVSSGRLCALIYRGCYLVSRIVKTPRETVIFIDQDCQIRDEPEKSITLVGPIVPERPKPRQSQHILEVGRETVSWQTDPAGLTVQVSQNSRRVLGMDSEDIRGFGWISKFHPEDIQGYVKARQEAREKGAVLQFSFRWRMPVGDYRIAAVVACPVKTDDGLIYEGHTQLAR